MATGLPALFCKTVVPVLDSAVLIRPAGTGDSGLRLCGAVSYLLMVHVTLASNLVRKSILEFSLIVELLVKLGQTFTVIQSMILLINLAT